MARKLIGLLLGLPGFVGLMIAGINRDYELFAASLPFCLFAVWCLSMPKTLSDHSDRETRRHPGEAP